MTRNGLPNRVVLTIELIADGRADEVGAVGVKPLLHQEIDVAEVHVAEIDGNFVAFRSLRSEFLNLAAHRFHPPAILVDGIWSEMAALQELVGAHGQIFSGADHSHSIVPGGLLVTS